MVDFTDVGPSPDNFVGANAVRGGSGRILSLAAAADGRRLYAGSYAGVWRSDDAGRNWRQMTRPQPATFDAEVPGALFAPYVVDLAVSPGDANLVIAAAESSLFAPLRSRDGLYRSTDGGATWSLVQALPSLHAVSQVAFAPDDPNLVMAALGPSVAVSTNAGANWTLVRLNAANNPAWHVAIGPATAQRSTRSLRGRRQSHLALGRRRHELATRISAPVSSCSRAPQWRRWWCRSFRTTASPHSRRGPGTASRSSRARLWRSRPTIPNTSTSRPVAVPSGLLSSTGRTAPPTCRTASTAIFLSK